MIKWCTAGATGSSRTIREVYVCPSMLHRYCVILSIAEAGRRTEYEPVVRAPKHISQVLPIHSSCSCSYQCTVLVYVYIDCSVWIIAVPGPSLDCVTTLPVVTTLKDWRQAALNGPPGAGKKRACAGKLEVNRMDS